jgi:hypothetical protein
MILLLALLAAAAMAAVPAGHKSTPWGFIREECHHSVPSGSVLEPSKAGGFDVLVDGARVAHLPKCPFPREEMFHRRERRRQFPSDYDGWLAYTQWKYAGQSQSIDKFIGSFTVPDMPASTPDVLYVFTGLQDDDFVPIVDPSEPNFDIIQPVLQYPADSGIGWSAKSWFVTLDIGAVASNEISFAVNSTVFGNMTRTGPTSYFIDSVNPATNKHTHITVNHARLSTQAWAFTTIECYGCTDSFGGSGCSYLPTQPTQFTHMLLESGGKPIKPQWKALVSPNPICNTKANILGPAKVTFTFQ